MTPTVFVVDDDPAVRRSLSRLLRSAQLEVATFGSAQEFLERHDPRAPGCLVLDVSMPGLDGLDSPSGPVSPGPLHFRSCSSPAMATFRRVCRP